MCMTDMRRLLNVINESATKEETTAFQRHETSKKRLAKHHDSSKVKESRLDIIAERMALEAKGVVFEDDVNEATADLITSREKALDRSKEARRKKSYTYMKVSNPENDVPEEPLEIKSPRDVERK